MFSAPAEWIQGLSFGACFKSLVPCCHLHFLSRTAPLSIRHVQNSRIWQIYREEHIFALDKSLKSHFCDFEAWIEEIDAADFVDFQWGRLDPRSRKVLSLGAGWGSFCWNMKFGLFLHPFYFCACLLICRMPEPRGKSRSNNQKNSHCILLIRLKSKNLGGILVFFCCFPAFPGE